MIEFKWFRSDGTSQLLEPACGDQQLDGFKKLSRFSNLATSCRLNRVQAQQLKPPSLEINQKQSKLFDSKVQIN